jgi:hypothetical protein
MGEELLVDGVPDGHAKVTAAVRQKPFGGAVHSLLIKLEPLELRVANLARRHINLNLLEHL